MNMKKLLIYRLVKYIVKFISSTGVLLTLVLSWTDDGNIWGIYITDGRLVIGDFWAGLIITYLLWLSIEYIQDIWWYSTRLHKNIRGEE